MKLIGLTHILFADKIYSVSLGNATRHEFKSKRAANDFLTATNKFLTRKLYEINNHSITLNSQYRQYWGYATPAQTRHLKQAIETINSALDLAVMKAHFENGNFFTFNHLSVAISNAIQASSTLKAIALNRRETVRQYEFEAAIKNLCALRTEITDYGVQEATETEIHVPVFYQMLNIA